MLKQEISTHKFRSKEFETEYKILKRLKQKSFLLVRSPMMRVPQPGRVAQRQSPWWSPRVINSVGRWRVHGMGVRARKVVLQSVVGGGMVVQRRVRRWWRRRQSAQTAQHVRWLRSHSRSLMRMMRVLMMLRREMMRGRNRGGVRR